MNWVISLAFELKIQVHLQNHLQRTTANTTTSKFSEFISPTEVALISLWFKSQQETWEFHENQVF